MPSQPHTSSHSLQPTQVFSSTSTLPRYWARFSPDGAMQSNGHTSMHTPHPLQLSGCTMAIGRSWRFNTLVTLPQVSRIASSGQMTPHAPQSMQSVGSMKKAFFGSPLIACVGQRFSHAVHPVQFSATIVKGMKRRYQRASAATTCGRGSALHFLQDFVLPPL